MTLLTSTGNGIRFKLTLNLDEVKQEYQAVSGSNNKFSEFYKQISGIEDDNDKHIDDLCRQHFPRMIKNNVENFEYYSTEKFDTKFSTNSTEQLSLVNINIRGIGRNYDNLLMYLNSFKHKFDVIVLNECHIQNNPIHKVNLHSKYPIEGYDMYYKESCIKYGGIIIYIKSKYKATYFSDLTKTNEIYDSLYLKIDTQCKLNNRKNKSLYIAGYYRHARYKNDDLIKFIDQFDNDLSHKIIAKNDVIISGDFNICLMKSTSNNDSLSFLNTILQNNFECTIFLPTRIEHYKNSLQVKSATIIDQIITNLFALDYSSGNLFYPDSDHYANFVIFPTYFDTISETDNEIYYRRFFNNINEDEIHEDIDNYDWDKLVYNEPNLDTASDNLTNKIVDLADKHAPLTKVPNRKMKYCHKPWIDKELLLEIKLKNKLYRKARKCPTEANKKELNIVKNRTTRKLRTKKKDYFQKYFTKFKNNSRKMWDGINLALEQTKYKKSLPTTIKNIDGTTMDNPNQIAAAFAKYFERVPQTTKCKIPHSRFHYLDYLQKSKPIDNYLVLYDTNNIEVLKHIMKLKNNSSSGPVAIPNRFIKIIAYPLSYLLGDIINRSMRSGYVPVSFKIGKQTPVFKSGEDSIQNFRPITVCSSLSKILEKIVRERVMEFLDQNKILNSSQFGFRKKHSTNHAIINLTETTLEALDENLKVGGIFLDIAKAFDCVNHDILLRKLEYYGFREASLSWFESYLKDRTQYVNIKQHKSKMYKLKTGVPQGGILAPVLFIIFMNDIIHSSDIFDFSMYADDTCLILGLDKNNYEATIKIELEKVVDWFSSNELMLNIKKTDYLNFGPHYKKCYIKGEYDLSDLHTTAPLFCFEKEDYEPEGPDHTELNKKGEYMLQDLHNVCPAYFFNEFIVMPDGNYIFEPPDVKYLGVYIDNTLSYNKHINILCCKVNRIVGILWKCPHLSIKTKKIIYHSLVESHLNYGILMWGSNLSKNITGNYDHNHIPSNLKNLNKTINKVVRAIFRKPKYDKINKVNTPSSPLYKELDVLKLYDLYYYNLASIVHDFYYEEDFPSKLGAKFIKKEDITTVKTRHNENELYYQNPRIISTFKKTSLSSAAYWNTIPLDIRSTRSKITFKRKLKLHLMLNY